MITVEGLKGDGTLWCTFKPPLYDVTGIPADVTSMCQVKYLRHQANAPFECLLPPVTDSSVSFPVEFSSYGPRVTKIEVGSLDSVDDSPGVPHPCKHSTVNGSLLYYGSDITDAPTFRIPKTLTTNYKKCYLYDNSPAVFDFGIEWNDGLGYNRFGELVASKSTMSNLDLWYDPTALISGYKYRIGSSVPRPAGVLDLKAFLFKPTYGLPVDWAKGPAQCSRFDAHHPSFNVFEDQVEVEYHHDASYAQESFLGPYSGLGYTHAYCKFSRSHRIVSIQSDHPTNFRILVETVQNDTEWGYFVPLVGWSYGVTPGMSVTQWIPLQVLSPGLSNGGSEVSDIFTDYCQRAMHRASELFSCQHASVARSAAVSDVTGLDSNWIENLSQAKDTPAVFNCLFDGQKAVKNGNIAAARRALSSAYLAYKYVVAPSISDYHDVADNSGNVVRSFTKYRFSNERRRGMFETSIPVLETIATTSYFTTLHLQLKDSSFAAVWNALERLGLDPEANNLWDCVPFSFVVDWFLKIGPTLDVISAYNNNKLTRDIKSRVETFKVQWPLTENDLILEKLTDYSVVSPLVYSWYDRRIYSGMGTIDPFAGQSLDGPSLSQVIQGGALLSVYR